jgi:hypothetical protein
MGQEKLYMGQESLMGWDRRIQFDGTEKVDIILKQDDFLATNVPFFTRV